MTGWQIETCGMSMLVIRRHARKQQDIARDNNGRIIWFESSDTAQAWIDARKELEDTGK